MPTNSQIVSLFFQNDVKVLNNIPILINLLVDADDEYYNQDDSFISDSQYDTIRKYCKNKTPADIYFTGIGSEVRGGKIDLPYQLGSLDQIYDGDMIKWISKLSIQHESIVVTEKMDGVSALVILDSMGNFQISYSRGDGIKGADTSRHVKHIIPSDNDIGFCTHTAIRGELILSREHFKHLLSLGVVKSNGEPYKTPRAMVAGLMNSSKLKFSDTINELIYKFIKFVAYDVLNSFNDKTVQLVDLRTAGFTIVRFVEMSCDRGTDEFLERILNQFRDTSDFEIDGIVLDVNDKNKRDNINPTRDTLNPAYAVKFKVASDDNEGITKVRFVEWRPSKHNYAKPRIHLEPIELLGTTVIHTNGFNMKYIVDNNIGPGTELRMTKTGDVIPYILEVVNGTKADLPEDDWEWIINDEGEKVEAVYVEDQDSAHVNMLVDFFTSLQVPHLKKGNVTKLIESSLDTREIIIQATREQLTAVIGENGKKIYDGLHKALNPIQLYKLVGAFSTERGIGIRKIKPLQQHCGLNFVNFIDDSSVHKITKLDGFEIKSALKILTTINKFNIFIKTMDDYITIADNEFLSLSTELQGENICFTGFRNAELSAEVELKGGKMQSTISGKTTLVVCKDLNDNSTKLDKARDLKIKIISITHLQTLLEG